MVREDAGSSPGVVVRAVGDVARPFTGAGLPSADGKLKRASTNPGSSPRIVSLEVNPR
jgi:hypothetical protein